MTLIEQVIAQIKQDFENQDFMALEVLLETVSEESLRAYLPEDPILI